MVVLRRIYVILVERLCCKLWGDCSLTEGAQALVDLLDHFDFAKKITSVLIQVEHHSGQKYFIPCMLKNISQNNMQVRRKGHLQGALKKAATLHMFSTKYVSPGFFFRLAACLTENKKYTLFLKVVPTEIALVFATMKSTESHIRINFWCKHST